MRKIQDICHVGISATVLYQPAVISAEEHLCAISRCSKLLEFDTLDTYIHDDKKIRQKEFQILQESGKRIIYNAPTVFQLDGPYNPVSDNLAYRKNALNYAKQHIDFAQEAGSKIFVYTSPRDKGESQRGLLIKRFEEFSFEIASYAEKRGIDVVLEPLERFWPKECLMGPTSECAAFVTRLKGYGARNMRLMLDVAHLPLMHEEFEQALEQSVKSDLCHVHLGNAVLQKESVFYGHTHPPLGVQGGMFDVKELSEQLRLMFRYGYLQKEPIKEKTTLSLEVQCYPGVSLETSARVGFEKLEFAMCQALAQ